MTKPPVQFSGGFVHLHLRGFASTIENTNARPSSVAMTIPPLRFRTNLPNLKQG